MAKRVFSGSDIFPAAAAARGLAGFRNENGLSDLGRILLVLPGQLAKKSVLQLLPDHFPAGLLTPQLLTPGTLLNFGREEFCAVPAIAEEILWGKVLTAAAARQKYFREVFPGGRVPVDCFAASRNLRTFRDELTANGFSIADAAKELGSRGEKLAELEQLYLRELANAGFTDKLEYDRQSVTDVAAFADIDRIILAGLPDLPRMLKLKLENIDRQFPGKIEIWINDDEVNAGDYDGWGVPIPEVWQEKTLPLPLENIHPALDPIDAARQAMTLSGDPENFSPENCTIVLSDPSLYPDFAGEFSRLQTKSGKITVADPAGVPFGKLRICRLLNALLALLEKRRDYQAASELFREDDFLAAAIGESGSSSKILALLDEFQQQYYPDDLDSAKLKFTDRFAPLQQLVQLAEKYLQFFDGMPLTGFLRKVLTRTFFHVSGSDEFLQVAFAGECDLFNEKLAELEALPEKTAAIPGKISLLKILLRNCRELPVNIHTPADALTFEGRLEMPFLTSRRVIFCGMNEEYFPDKIDITPYLTDTLRKKLGMRSNQETLARSLCHLFNVAMPRQNGDLQILVLKSDSKKSALSPSRILFSGKDLPQDELLARCGKLFADPPVPPTLDTIQANRIFRLKPELRYRTANEGKPLFAVTDFDQYLRNPFSYFWQRVLKSDAVDYEIMEPDHRSEGTFCHKAFELLGTEHFSGEKQLLETLLARFDEVLTGHFGTLPAMVRIYADNMKQRFHYAAELLYREQTAGFEVLATEYRFGGEADFLEYAGAVFRGSIDRIEYSRTEKIIRIIDIKTGAPHGVIAAHCKYNKKSGSYTFSKIQLPLYAILLRHDPWFKEHLCPEIDDCTIECGYLNLPAAVTDTVLDIWKSGDPADPLALNNVTAAAENEILRIIDEICKSRDHQVFCDPDSINEPLLLPDAASALTGIDWICDRQGTEVREVPETIPDEQKIMLPVNRAGNSRKAGNTRCCTCPVTDCPCRNGDCSSCASFNGFKAFNIITASAGTGKTFALASRFVQLMDYGVKPENILAITFTRKATGEILDRIVRRLCSMIEKPDKAENRCIRIAMPRRLELLRQLLCCSSKAPRISTIDSFFMNLLKVFAPELGIWGEISMLDEFDLRPVKETIRAWVNTISDGEELNTLRELIKDANSSRQISFFAAMQELAKKIYPCYLLQLKKMPDGSFPQLEYAPWQPQSSDVMTPELCICTENILMDQAESYDEQLKQKTCTADARSLKALIKRMRSLSSELAKSRHGELFGKIAEDTKKLFAAINENNLPGWCDGPDDDELLYIRGKDKNPEKARNKDIIFPPETARAVRLAMRHIRALSYLQVRRKNRAVFALMQKFDRVYTELIRNSGKLTFDDPPALLCRSDPETGELILGPGDHSLEMRMDARISHYMFDEFQDTSDIQLLSLLPLLRELFAKADSDGFRSFFCVGDIKQAIYLWRSGNPQLFDYLAAQVRPITGDQYDPCDSLSCSYRSSQVVLDTVNAVFADNCPSEQPYFKEALAKMKFLPHTSAVELDGHTAVIEVAKDSSSEKRHLTEKSRIIAQILNEIQPFKRGLTAGILVRTNDVAKEIYESLRTFTDLPASVDGKISPSQSMSFNVFRELLILAGHPDDDEAVNFFDSLTFASENDPARHLTGEELAEKLGFAAGIPLDEAVRKELFCNGVYGMARRFVDAFAGEVTAGERRYLEILLRLARDFNGSAADFISHAGHAGESGNALTGTIQIMTIHKSKGLEFDIVFLPDMENHQGNNSSLTPEFAPVDMADCQYADDLPSPQWASYLPPAEIRYNIDPFRQHDEEQSIGDAFAKSCNLYVAMTRAKHALYMLLSCGKTSTTLAPDMLIKERLSRYRCAPGDQQWLESLSNDGYPAVLHFSHGDRLWAGKNYPFANQTASTEKFTLPGFIPAPKTVIATASGTEKHHFTGDPAQRFAPLSGKTGGTLIHELFAKLEYVDENFDAANFSRDLPPDAAEVFCSALTNGSPIRELLKRPDQECELWLERRFLLKNAAQQLVPGAFDRVQIFRDNGKITQAEIIDYKSDRIKSAAGFEIYFEQLRSYRNSLSILLDLPEEQISCKICALRLNEIIEVK
ncbi:MAG: hypothetical protein E7058_05900 [Lentisphaerae bacterium]|nr:hypothetical protein [Lentisphaerota bacterium]